MRPLSARAHCDSHSPGQRPNIEALVGWQSHAAERNGAGRRFASSAATDTTGLDLPEVLQRAPPAPPDAIGEVQVLDRAALAWQAPPAGTSTQCLGSLHLWRSLADDVEWIDLALSVHQGGRWISLPVELNDAAGSPAAAPRSYLALDDDAASALAGLGIEPAALAAAAARTDAACWVCRLDGLGAFVAGLVDLGWPAG